MLGGSSIAEGSAWDSNTVCNVLRVLGMGLTIVGLRLGGYEWAVWVVLALDTCRVNSASSIKQRDSEGQGAVQRMGFKDFQGWDGHTSVRFWGRGEHFMVWPRGI